MKKYILTIDQGTTSTRAILFDHKASTIGIYQMEFTQICPKSGYVEHNADEIYQTVLECIKNVIINGTLAANVGKKYSGAALLFSILLSLYSI